MRWRLGSYGLATFPQVKDLVRDCLEAGQNEIMMPVAYPGGLEQEGGGARRAGRFGVLPLVADHKAVIQAQAALEAGLDQQAGFGFAAGTAIGFIMGANEDVIERKDAAEQLVHAFQLAAGLVAAR